MPTDARGVYEAYAPGIEHAAESGLVAYVPTFHPWSIYRIDNQASHIAMLLDHAAGVLDIRSCGQLYEQVRADPSRAAGPAGAPSGRLRGRAERAGKGAAPMRIARVRVTHIDMSFWGDFASRQDELAGGDAHGDLPPVPPSRCRVGSRATPCAWWRSRPTTGWWAPAGARTTPGPPASSSRTTSPSCSSARTPSSAAGCGTRCSAAPCPTGARARRCSPSARGHRPVGPGRQALRPARVRASRRPGPRPGAGVRQPPALHQRRRVRRRGDRVCEPGSRR